MEIGTNNENDPNRPIQVEERVHRLISCMTALKVAYMEGSAYFFTEMCDADGNFLDVDYPALLAKLESGELEDDDLPGEPCVPWAKDTVWAWPGANHALLRFLHEMLDEHDWTLENLEEAMIEVHGNWEKSGDRLEMAAKRHGVDVDELHTIMKAAAEIAVHAEEGTMTVWSITCVIHKNCSNFHESIAWTEERVEKGLSILQEIGAIDKIPAKQGDDNNG